MLDRVLGRAPAGLSGSTSRARAHGVASARGRDRGRSRRRSVPECARERRDDRLRPRVSAWHRPWSARRSRRRAGANGGESTVLPTSLPTSTRSATAPTPPLCQRSVIRSKLQNARHGHTGPCHLRRSAALHAVPWFWSNSTPSGAERRSQSRYEPPFCGHRRSSASRGYLRGARSSRSTANKTGTIPKASSCQARATIAPELLGEAETRRAAVSRFERPSRLATTVGIGE